MGAVSDWINIGDLGRMRSWMLAVATAMAGLVGMESAGIVDLTTTYPPYRTPQLAWLRYLAGGLLFGVGMTLASGCGNKTLVRIGGGNLKSVLVLAGRRAVRLPDDLHRFLRRRVRLDGPTTRWHSTPTASVRRRSVRSSPERSAAMPPRSTVRWPG
jgi:hypothetical protein